MFDEKRYTCRGPVRGDCGVMHKTREAAEKHCEQDSRDVKRGSGPNAYSDRSPRVVRSGGRVSRD